MFVRKENSWVLLSVLVLSACPAPPPPPPPPPPAAAISGCSSGRSWVVECAGEATRIDWLVVDEQGAPVENVLVNFGGGGAGGGVKGLPYKRDTNTYPSKTTEFDNGYDLVCTNEEGRASMCFFDTTALPFTTVIEGLSTGHHAVKSGYAIFNSNEAFTLAEGEVKTIQVTLKVNAAATEEKILLVPGNGNGNKEPLALAGKDLRFSIPDTGKIMETLLADPSNPLRDFDTLILGDSRANNVDMFELLDATNKDLLFEWVNAGGLLIFDQPNDTGWSKTSNCPASFTLCAKDIFPTDYQFDMLYDNNCNNVETGDIFDASHPFVAGLATPLANFAFSNYYTTGSGTSSLLAADTIDARTVNKNVWKVLIAGPSSDTEVTAKQASCKPPYNAYGKNEQVILMEANYGAGKILINRTQAVSYISALLNNGTSDPKLETLMNNYVAYLRAHQPQ